MRDRGAFREAITPNGEYSLFGPFESNLTPEHFADEWREATAAPLVLR